MKIHDKTFALYRSNEEVLRAIDQVAAQIRARYAPHMERPLVLLVTLSGAVPFGLELARRIGLPLEWAFIKCSSYGDRLYSSGKVLMEVLPTMDLAGRDVLVVEDIIDSGNTWCTLHEYLSDKGLRSLAVASLVLKPTAYTKSLPIDFVALEAEDRFLVGYGMDYNQLGRELDGIYVLTSC